MTGVTFELSAAAVARSRGLGEAHWSPGASGGSHLGWLEVAGGRVDLVIAPADGSVPPLTVTAAVPVTRLGSYGGGGWCWAPDGEHVVYAAVDGRLLVLPRAGGPVRELATDGTAAAPACSPRLEGGLEGGLDGGRVAFVRETDDTCRVAVVALDGSAPPVEVSHADYAWDPAWSADGAWVAWHEWDLPAMPWDASRVVVARADGSEPRVVAGDGTYAVSQPRFSPDGTRLAWVSDATGWMQVWVATFDTADGTIADARPLLDEPHEHAEPAWGPGQRSHSWSPDGASIALNRNEDGFGRLVIVDVESGEVRERSKGWHHGIDWGTPGLVCVRSGGRTAPQVTVFDAAGQGSDGRRSLARGAPGELDALDLPEPDPVTWTGADGATVHGILWRPLVAAGDPPPLLVDVHGGPTGQAVVGWSPRVRWFLSRGWAVFAPNPRGSTGYGRPYLRALDEGWGVVDVADTVTGIRALAAQGAVDGNRVAVMGGSAGGFTALLVGTVSPPVARAVVSLYGVTDLLGLAATTHRFESTYLDSLVGPLPECEARYRERSPSHRAHEITVPVLVLQGDDDKVVPPAQAQLVVDALRAADTPVEHHVYAGEGHGWSRPETVIDALERTATFLEQWVLQ